MIKTLRPEDYDFLKKYEETISNRNKPKGKRYNPTRIRLKSTGEFFVSGSGKTIWNNIGPAKAALRNDFPDLFNYTYTINRDYRHSISAEIVTDYQIRKDRTEMVYQEFLNNWVEFIPA